MKRSNSMGGLARKGSLEDILNMFPDEEEEEAHTDNNHKFSQQWNQTGQRDPNQNNNKDQLVNTTTTPIQTQSHQMTVVNNNAHDERSYLVKSESMTSLSSFGEALDLGTLNSPIRPQPIHLRSSYSSEMQPSASSTSLTDYVDSSTLLKSASSGSLTNLHAVSGSLLNKSFSSSSFSRFQEELEDDEEYNRKYHGAHANLPMNQDGDHNVVMPPHMMDDHRQQQYLPPMNPNDSLQNDQDCPHNQLHSMHPFSTQQHDMYQQQQPPQQQVIPQQQQTTPQRQQHEQLSQQELNAPNRVIVQYGSEQYTSIDGRLYNDRGYKICGHLNQHNRPCQRIGRCPFHDKLRSLEDQSNNNNNNTCDESTEGAPIDQDMQLTPSEPTSAFTKKPRKKKSDHGHVIQMNTLMSNDDKMNSSPLTPVHHPSPHQLHAQTLSPPTSSSSSTHLFPGKKVPFKQGWNKDEHMRFLTGLQQHGKGAWKEIATIVGTRTPTQIQSHAQKYFLRQKQKNKNKRSIHDFTMDDLNKLMSNGNSSNMGSSSSHLEDEDGMENESKPKKNNKKKRSRSKIESEEEEEEDDLNQNQNYTSYHQQQQHSPQHLNSNQHSIQQSISHLSPLSQQQQQPNHLISQQMIQQIQQQMDPQQTALIQNQVQQILQGSLGQLLVNGITNRVNHTSSSVGGNNNNTTTTNGNGNGSDQQQHDPNALLAMIIQNKFGDLYRQAALQQQQQGVMNGNGNGNGNQMNNNNNMQSSQNQHSIQMPIQRMNVNVSQSQQQQNPQQQQDGMDDVKFELPGKKRHRTSS